MAEQIGVHKATIYNWESNASTPALRCIPAILRFLGYNPLPPGETLQERLTTMRKVLGLSRGELALTLGVDPATWEGWETGQHRPSERNVGKVEQFLRTCGNGAA